MKDLLAVAFLLAGIFSSQFLYAGSTCSMGTASTSAQESQEEQEEDAEADAALAEESA